MNNSLKNLKRAFALTVALLSVSAYGQIIGTNCYMIGDFLEIGINGNGHEGAASLAGSNNRSNQVITSPVYFGFVANPLADGWTNYDGDFFTPGSPENGFGFEIAGTNYHNNCNFNSSTTPGSITGYNLDGDCMTAFWEGSVAGLDIEIMYKMITTELYYTTTVYITNTTGSDMTDIYYYRNFDPDNNVTIGGGYGTQNTIVDQWDVDCSRSLVTAEQTTPWASYVGMGGVDPDLRVTYGGFINRDASNIWNGTGFTSAEGSTAFADQAISLAHRTYTLAPGEVDTFSFAIILAEAELDAAFSGLCYFNYEGSGGVVDVCNPIVDTALTCAGDPVTISVDGPGAADYTWTWGPATGLSTTSGPTTDASPGTTTTYTVTGTPAAGCLATAIVKDIVVDISPAPDVTWTDPGPQCMTFDLNTLVVTDLNAIPGAITNWYSVPPDSALQTVGLLPDMTMEPGDVVYVMMYNPVTNCFDFELVTIVFDSLVNAGPDYAESNCSGAGLIDLVPMITGDAGGAWAETTIPPAGTLDPTAGTFDITGLPPGDYTIEYTVAGGACPDDVAVITLTVEAEVNAGLDAVSSLCNSAGSTIDLNTLLSGADVGGLWTETTTSGAFDDVTAIFDGSGLTAGIYTFTYTVPAIFPCLTDVADFTVTVEQEANAGADNTVDICNSAGTSVDMNTLLVGADAGGTWLETSGSGSFDPTTGVLDTDGLAAGVYTFTYTVGATAPCAPDAANFSVTVQNEPDAGLDNAVTSCDLPGSSVDLNTLLFGADAGGTWAETSASGTFDPTTGILITAGLPSGLYTFTYTLTGIAPCVDDVADFTVSVSSSMNAGADDLTITSCNTAGVIIDLDDYVVGGDLFGTWVETTASGAFTPPSGEFDVTGLPAGAYTFTYTVFPAAPCLPDVADFTITIQEEPTAGADNDGTICNSAGSTIDVNTLLIGADAGGTWVETSASGAFTPATGVLDAGGLTAGIYTFTYTAFGVAPCLDDVADFTVTVTNLPNAGADDITTTICNSTGSMVDLDPLTTGDPGGLWTETSASGAFDPTTGELLTEGLAEGTYTFTYDIAASGPCPGDQALFEVFVAQEMTAGLDDLTPAICNTAGSMVDLMAELSGADAGGTWTETTASGAFTPATGVLNTDGLPAGVYTFTYEVFPTAPCPSDLADFTVTVQQDVDAGLDNLDLMCNSTGAVVDLNDLLDPLADAGGLWNETTGSGSFDTGTAVFDGTGLPGGAYVFTYAVLATAPCVTDAATFTITVNESPTVGPLTDEELCDESNLVSQNFTSDVTGTTYTWSVTSGVDVGFGTSGAGGTIGSFTGNTGSTTDETVTIEVIPTANGCVGDPVTFDITVHPLPIIGFSADEYLGCEPFRVEFTNSNPGAPGTICEWQFGDGTTGTTCDLVSHEFMTEGIYDVTLTMTTEYGCTDTWTEDAMIEVYPEAVASFTYAPHEITVEDTEVEFTNSSVNADSYTWEFGDHSSGSSETDPTHTFPEEGNMDYTVTLYAHSPGGCDDETTVLIHVKDVIIFFVPNIFTPDGDQYNEVFKPIMSAGVDVYDYHLSIYNRWGELIFESFNKDFGWDGTYGNGGLVEDGVFIWAIEFGETMSDKKHKHKGHVTILK